MSLSSIAKKYQGLDRLVPIGMRLPLRYRLQSILGALEPEVALLPELLRGAVGRTALDVGANLGIYTLALSRLGMKVHAFEPQPACCEVLSAWARGNPQVVVHNVGVGAAAGELVLHVPIVDGHPVPTRASFQPFGHEQLELRVPVLDLDSVDAGDIAFVKIDVEGFELPVLNGAMGILSTMKPVLLIEIDRQRHDRQSFDQVIGLLSGLGYKSHIYVDGRLTSCGTDAWSVPKSHYNFIFIA